MIGTLFVEGDNASVEPSMEDRKTKVRLTIRFHIPNARATPMLVVAPTIDLGLTADGNAVDIGAKHLATVDQQLGIANAIMIVGGFAIVVGPESKAYPAPCRKLTG